MKKYLYIITALLTLSACDSYFDIDFQDQANLEEIFAKKNTTERLEMNKYCRFCRKHTVHTETK